MPTNDSTLVSIDESRMTDASLTLGGQDRFTRTVREYADELLNKSTEYYIAETAATTNHEVTAEYVRKAAHYCASRFGLNRAPRWTHWFHAYEYIAAVGIGIGAGHIEDGWGVIVLVSAALTGLIAFMIRITHGGIQ